MTGLNEKVLIEQGLLIISALGTGLCAAGISNLLLARLLNFKPAITFKIPQLNRGSHINRADATGAVLGGVFMYLLSLGTTKIVNMTIIGFLAGYLITWLLRKQLEKMKQWSKQREIIVLFEAVELYMRAGLSMNHALQAAKLLTPALKPAINKALVYWPAGSAKALEIFRREVDLPEADILTALLAQIERVGISNLEGVIRREADRLQRMREAAERAEINRRPTYMMLYRALPLVSAMGMIAGVLFMHVASTLRSAGISF